MNVKLQVECENSTGNLNGIQRDYLFVKEVISESDDANPPPLPPEYPPRPSIMLHNGINEADVGNNGAPDDNDNYVEIYDRTDEDNPPPLPPESNNHNQDLENCYDDHYCVHSELIDSNPSMIPNDGEIVVLLSSVSRVEKNVMVKNEVMSGSFSLVEMVKTKVMSGRLFQSVYRVNSNINLNKILQIVLSIFLQLGCEWTLKKYQVDNDPKMDWILKWYRVDNDDELEWLMKRYTVDNDDDDELEWLMKRYTVDNDDNSCNNEPASRYDSRSRGIPTAAVAAELNANEIDDLVYYDSKNDGENEDNGGTFHDSTQAEDMSDDTYNDDNDVNRKPINNVIDHGEQHLTLHTSGCSDNYEDGYVNTKLEWSLKKCRVDNIKFDQKTELKRRDHTDATKEDHCYLMPDLLDHLDSISSKQDPYSNKQRIQLNHHDYSKHDLNQDPLKRAHSLQQMMSIPMERKDGECPDPEVKLYH